jgi:hypothetical protein
MQPMPHFKANAKLDALISDLRWRVQLLDADIEEEERKSRVFNRANPSYSRLALTMRERRDNLQTTVAALQKQLETLMSVTNERGRLSDPLPVENLFGMKCQPGDTHVTSARSILSDLT